jgi:conjugal transfer mating pair stabilization protein TraN
MKEAQREGGVYMDPNTLTMFNGDAGTCRDMALTSCCEVNSAGQTMSNQSILGVGQSYGSLAGTVLTNLWSWYGSPYVYDLLWQNLPFSVLNWAVDAGLITTTDLTASNSVTVYGVTFSETPTGLTYSVGWGFWIAIAIYIITTFMMCTPTQEEQTLSLKRGANLCYPIGSYCSSEILGMCYETTESFCCYNSVLNKEINVGGRQQLGLGFGTPEVPNCSGFNQIQLGQIDFSKIDFSEFKAQIQLKPQTNIFNQSIVTDNTKCVVGGTNANCVGKPSGVVHNTPELLPGTATR